MAETLTIRTAASTEVIKIAVQGPQGPAGAPGTGLETLTVQGDTLYRGASTGERLPIGSAGQVLKVVNGLPAWANESGAVSSVSGKTGAVSLDSTDIFTDQALQISDAGIADCNAVFVYGGLFNNRATYYATKDTFVYWDGSNWIINHNGDDQYFGTATTYPWQAVWSLGDGTNPLPVVTQAASHEFEQVVGQRTNPTSRGDAAGKNVGTGANDVAAGNHTHSAATQSVAGFLSAADKSKLDGIAAGAEVNVNADWNATSGDAQILNKPTIPTASTATPSALGVAAAGASSNFARADHVHAMPSASDVGAAPATGIDQSAVNSSIGNDTLQEDVSYLDGIVAGLGTAATADSTDFAAATHASSHAVGGSDALAPSDIGAQSIFVSENITSGRTLTARRARIYTVLNFGSAYTITLPNAANGSQNGDVAVFFAATLNNLVTIAAQDQANLVTLSAALEQYRFTYGAGNWSLTRVDSHEASRITSGTLDIARIPTGTGSTTVALGNHTHTPSEVGLGNVSNTAQVTSVTGTAPIVSSGGTTPAISISAATTSAAGSMSSADKTKLDGIAAGAEVNVNADWNASSGDAQILNKPTLGTAAAASTSDFAAASHSHELTALAATGATNGHVLTANGSGGVTFAAAAGGTPADNSITNAKLSQVATATIKGRTTAGTGNVEDLTASQARGVLALATTDNVTFGSLQGTPVGSTTRSSGAFTSLSSSQGTITASSPVTIAATWNNGNASFTALDFSIANTDSLASSNFIAFRAGASGTTTMAAITRAGAAYFGQGTVSIGDGANTLVLYNSGTLSFSSSGGVTANASTGDTILRRDAANTLAMYNTTNAQAFRLYSTFSSTTSFERLNIAAQTGGNFILGTEKGSGGGTARGLELRTDNVARITIGSAGQLGFFGATAAAQPTAVADATDAATVITQLNALLSRMRTLGLIAT